MGTAAAAEGPAKLGPQWPNYNNTLDGQRFSPLDQISITTSAQLVQACRIEIAKGGSFQTGPIVVGGTMYLTTARDTIALDPTNCEQKWRATYTPEAAELWTTNRGIAFLDGKLFRGTGDGRLLALDAATGATVWKDEIADPRNFEYLAAAPIAWNGVVYIGIAGGDGGIRGRMLAFDAATGREIWRFNTVPTGKERGADSWTDPKSAATGGGGTWSTYTLDVTAGELLIPVGNPAPGFLPRYRPGTNLFTDSLVVLDARTGGLKWWYQLIPHDGLDRDLAAAPAVVRSANGVELAVIAGKDGYLRAIDRGTHRQIYQVAVTRIENGDLLPTPEGIHFCPGILGGVEWNGVAYDGARDLLFVGAVDWCATYKISPGSGPPARGFAFQGGPFALDPAPATGWVTAVDASSGRVRWKYHADAPVVSGVTPTAGGVVLVGDLAGNLMVLNSDTGELVRKMPTGGAIAGGIVTYQIGGRQYVALTSGNVSRTANVVTGHPTVIVMTLPPNVGTVAGDAARGGDLYASNCASCHGFDGTAMHDHDLRKAAQAKTVDELEAWIRDPKPPMPRLFPSTLDETEVRDLAAFVHSLR